jgi:phospholipase C
MWRSRLLVRLSSAAIVVPFLFGAGPLNARAAQIPIDHVVVLMQENRSFDSYFGNLHFEGQPQSLPEPRGAQNPDPTNPDGPPIHVFAKTQTCEVADLNHSWNGTHQEIDGGQMDGFTAANVDPKDPSGSRTMGYYDQGMLPYYYALYNTFAMGDHYFASVPGPTFPNRLYLLAATSFGHIRNDLPTSQGQFSQPSIFDSLDAGGISWNVYAAQYPLSISFLFAHVRNTADFFKVRPVSQYYLDAAAGTLPQVSFVEPIYSAPNNVESDEHPTANVQVGEQFTSKVISSLFASPDWGSSALFLTYDEHGGFYDHVAPPAAVPPDDIAPMLQPGDVPAAFDLYGIRVPAAVISPYSRPHFVSHVVNDHTSILRFIETRFGLPALTRRDAAANPMLEFFDFSHQSFAVPPSLPAAPVFAAQAAYCNTVG